MFNNHFAKLKTEQSPEEKAKQLAFALEIKLQMADFLGLRKGEKQIENPLKYSELISTLSPDFSTVYNFRREILLKDWSSLDMSSHYFKLKEELILSSISLKKHPKNYSLWQHRYNL